MICNKISKPLVWSDLTDQDRIEIINSLPDYLEGFLKKWGWLNFSKATEAKIKEKNTQFLIQILEENKALRNENEELMHMLLNQNKFFNSK